MDDGIVFSVRLGLLRHRPHARKAGDIPDGHGMAFREVGADLLGPGLVAGVEDDFVALFDEQFARDEGEGERTRDWWLAAHRRFFSRRAEEEGFRMHDGIETVFERFEVVWPADAADM